MEKASLARQTKSYSPPSIRHGPFRSPSAPTGESVCTNSRESITILARSLSAFRVRCYRAASCPRGGASPAAPPSTTPASCQQPAIEAPIDGPPAAWWVICWPARGRTPSSASTSTAIGSSDSSSVCDWRRWRDSPAIRGDGGRHRLRYISLGLIYSLRFKLYIANIIYIEKLKDLLRIILNQRNIFLLILKIKKHVAICILLGDLWLCKFSFGVCQSFLHIWAEKYVINFHANFIKISLRYVTFRIMHHQDAYVVATMCVHIYVECILWRRP